jgi:hypothetical protein
VPGPPAPESCPSRSVPGAAETQRRVEQPPNSVREPSPLGAPKDVNYGTSHSANGLELPAIIQKQVPKTSIFGIENRAGAALQNSALRQRPTTGGLNSMPRRRQNRREFPGFLRVKCCWRASKNEGSVRLQLGEWAAVPGSLRRETVGGRRICEHRTPPL